MPLRFRMSNAVAQNCSRRMSPFPREQVVVDVQPGHRDEVTPDDRVGDHRAHLRARIAAVLDRVQRRLADVQARLVGLVPLGDARVQVPAVVVELLAGRERSDLVEPPGLEALEPDDDVGDLHAGVVDVVLDLDRRAQEPQQPPDGVAEDRIAQVADVGGLVRIDRGVLDDRLRPAGRGGRRRLAEVAAQERGAIEEDVDVPAADRLDARHAGDGRERGDDLLRDGAGRLAERARQLEGAGECQIAEGPGRRGLDDQRRGHGLGPVKCCQRVL